MPKSPYSVLTGQNHSTLARKIISKTLSDAEIAAVCRNFMLSSGLPLATRRCEATRIIRTCAGTENNVAALLLWLLSYEPNPAAAVADVRL